MSVPKIILLSGGSAAGKTYIVNKLKESIGEDNITSIAIDDYYKDLSDVPMEERKKVNFDHPKSIDWKLLRQDISKLSKGLSIDKPLYDFVVHNRKEEREHIVPKKIVILEGIFALVDKETRAYSNLNVYISCIRERRFLRRLIRDHDERGRSYESIVNQYFSTVQPMFEEVIEPSKNYADIVIDNSGYENKAIDIFSRIVLDLMTNQQED